MPRRIFIDGSELRHTITAEVLKHVGRHSWVARLPSTINPVRDSSRYPFRPTRVQPEAYDFIKNEWNVRKRDFFLAFRERDKDAHERVADTFVGNCDEFVFLILYLINALDFDDMHQITLQNREFILKLYQDALKEAKRDSNVHSSGYIVLWFNVNSSDHSMIPEHIGIMIDNNNMVSLDGSLLRDVSTIPINEYQSPLVIPYFLHPQKFVKLVLKLLSSNQYILSEAERQATQPSDLRRGRMQTYSLLEGSIPPPSGGFASIPISISSGSELIETQCAESGCHIPFSIINKHYCQYCGRAFCDEHSPAREQTKGNRCCHECYKKLAGL